MISMLKNIWFVLDKDYRNKVVKLQMFLIFAGFFELASIVSIGALMSLIGNLESIHKAGFWYSIYSFLNLENKFDFLFLSGAVVLFILSFSSIISIYIAKVSYRLSANIGISLSEKLFRYYINESWIFHSQRNSSDYITNISTEALRVNNTIIKPLLEINSKIFLILIFSISFFIYKPFISISFVILFTFVYFTIFKFSKNKLKNNSIILSQSFSNMFRIMGEGFGGMKEVIVADLNKHYSDQFYNCTEELAMALSDNSFMASFPRYLVELIAFGSTIIALLIMLKASEGGLVEVLPVISVVAFGGLKLLPAFQGVYTGISNIKGNASSFLSIENDLKNAAKFNSYDKFDLGTKNAINANKMISLKNIIFSYSNDSDPVIKGISIDIPVNNTIGIVGSSGSGKSTLVDLILKLIDPQSGSLTADSVEIDEYNKKSWMGNIGYVPQSIYLSDSSIAKNIAFGYLENEIDYKKIDEVIHLAHAHDFINDLPNGLATTVGERGVQLSGGQRQRIGIARALYRDPSILIFDEATSALDSISERYVMNAINALSGSKTIIMIAHRIKTVEKCDFIYLMEKGKVIDEGTFDDLYLRSEFFKAGLELDVKNGDDLNV